MLVAGEETKESLSTWPTPSDQLAAVASLTNLQPRHCWDVCLLRRLSASCRRWPLPNYLLARSFGTFAPCLLGPL